MRGGRPLIHGSLTRLYAHKSRSSRGKIIIVTCKSYDPRGAARACAHARVRPGKPHRLHYLSIQRLRTGRSANIFINEQTALARTDYGETLIERDPVSIYRH